MKRQRPKVDNVPRRARECVDAGRFRETEHARIRYQQRGISRLDVIETIRSGIREPRKDQYQEGFQSWNYAFRGVLEDNRSIRVIVAFDDAHMLLITVIELCTRYHDV